MQKLVFTNGNGLEIDLTAGNFGITKWEGLSDTSLNIQTQQVPFEDGGVFLDALMEQREISLTVAIYDGNNLELRYQKKRELISALNPKAGEGVLVYTNDYLTRQIKAVPQLPIFENKNSNDSGTLKASVVFSCPSPYWEDVEETEVILNQATLTQIENEGDVPTQLKATLFVSDAEDITLKNITTNNKIEISGEVNNNIELSTEYGKKSARLSKVKLDLKSTASIFDSFAYVKDNDYFYTTTLSGSETTRVVMKTKDFNTFESVGTGYECQDCIVYSDYFKKLYVFTEGTVYYSSDFGETWASLQISSQIIITSIIVGSQSVLLIGYDANENGIAYKSTNGTDFASVTISETSPIFEKGKFLNGNYILFVENKILVMIESGNSFSAYTINRTFNDMTFFGNIYYGVGASGLVSKHRSQDGFSTWTDIDVDIQNDITYILYNETLRQLMLCINNYLSPNNPAFAISYDGGESWQKINIPYSLYRGVVCIIYSKERGFYYCCAKDHNNYNIILSSDGITWNPIFDNTTMKNDIFYNERLGVYVGYGIGYVVYKSSDLINWQSCNNPSINISKLKYFEDIGQTVVIGTGANARILVTNDLVNWIDKGSAGIMIEDLAYSNDLGLYCAISYGNVYTSQDLINFDLQTLPEEVGGSLMTVVYAKYLKKFITGGGISRDSGVLFLSNDGVNWEKVSTFRDAVVGLFVAEDIKVVCVSTFGGSSYLSFDDYVTKTGYDFSSIKSLGGNIIWSKKTGKLITICPERKPSVLYPTVYVIRESTDGYNWNDVPIDYLLTFGQIIEDVQKYNEFFVYAQYNTIFKYINVSDTNIINRIATGSNMGLQLEQGENTFLISAGAGDVRAVIRYRQKYIGV